MNRSNQFPPGWDEEGVRKVLAHYEGQSDDEELTEDEVAWDLQSQTTMEIPTALVPSVRELIAKHQE